MLLTTHLETYSPLAPVANPAVTLAAPAVLDISLCLEFWESTQRVRNSEIKVVIDLRATVSIHDSGYMLLRLLEESLDKERADLLLIHCRPHLKKALQSRGFERQFMIL